jgi:hypothetical protein
MKSALIAAMGTTDTPFFAVLLLFQTGFSHGIPAVWAYLLAAPICFGNPELLIIHGIQCLVFSKNSRTITNLIDG